MLRRNHKQVLLQHLLGFQAQIIPVDSLKESMKAIDTARGTFLIVKVGVNVTHIHMETDLQHGQVIREDKIAVGRKDDRSSDIVELHGPGEEDGGTRYQSSSMVHEAQVVENHGREFGRKENFFIAGHFFTDERRVVEGENTSRAGQG